MEKHKINREKFLKRILVFLAGHLGSMPKGELIRLLKCLVTYVRQCEDYLINVRQIVEERRLEFSEADA